MRKMERTDKWQTVLNYATSCYLPVHKCFAYIQYIVYRVPENSHLQTTQTDSLLNNQKKFLLDKNYRWIRDGNETYLQKSLPVFQLKTLNAKSNHICHLLALLGAHRILYVSRIRTNVFQFPSKFLRGGACGRKYAYSGTAQCSRSVQCYVINFRL